MNLKGYHRRVTLQLLLISAALFALAVAQKAVELVEEDEAREAAETTVPAFSNPVDRLPNTYRPGATTLISRDLLAEDEAGEEAEVAEPGEGRLPLVAPAGGRLVPPEEVVEMLQQIMEEEVTNSIEDCLHAWWMLDPALAGRVVLEFKLDATGLAEAGIRDHSDVPVGPLTCFAAALYAADWPGSEGETTVHYPVEFDNGEEDPDEGLQDSG